MGYILVDDMVVTLVRKPQLTGLTPPSGGSAELYFVTGQAEPPSAFAVEAASAAEGPYSTIVAPITTVPAGGFKATVPATADQSFYRVKRLPMSFP